MATTRPKTGPKSRPKPEQRPADSGARSFFDGLERTGQQPIFKGESGTLRFDLSGGPELERWYVTIADGTVTVSQRASRADTIVKVDGELFDRFAVGTANAMTAQLRGVLVAEGDLHLLMVFQRLFPGPPRSSTARRPSATDRTETPHP
jgi:hypothetical protein